MPNTLLSRMPMGQRFNVGVALALVPILSLCYGLLAYEWSTFRSADEAQRQFASLRAALLAMETISAERESTNSVLGEDLPIPASSALALSRARSQSDEEIATLFTMLRLDNCATCADDSAKVARLKAMLSVARRNVDRLASLARTRRSDHAVQDIADQMVVIVDEFGPIVVSGTSAVTRGDRNALDYLFMARLSAQLREQAGRLGSHFTGALVLRRPLTLDEKLALERTRGRIDQLQMMIDIRMADHPALAAQAFAAMNAQYFSTGEPYAKTVEALTDRLGGANLTTAQFAQHYVATLRPIVGFRDATLDAAQKELHDNRVTALCTVVCTAVAQALLLAVLGWAVFKFRRDVVNPFAHATHAIRAIASGDLSKEVPASSLCREIRELFDAIRILKTNSIERSRLGAEHARLMQELALMAETDSLTRLLNRRAFESRARAFCARSQADGSDIALMMFDIDHFKCINDTYGHAVGDDALRLIARLCRRYFARSEIVARIGGEEFAVMTRVRQPHEAYAAAERIRKIIATSSVPTDRDTNCRMTASFGIAFASPNDGADLTHLLKEADRMLYEAKMAGRNRVMVARSATAVLLEARPQPHALP